MVSFEFIVDGPPVSQQTRRRERYHEWKRVVRAAAERYWPGGLPPLTGPLSVRVYYFFDGAPVDIDNIVKPIHDAIVGLVYEDDLQVTDSVNRRRDLRGQFSITNLTPALAEGLAREREFLYVAIAPAPSTGELD
ncbi:MAG: RusA family crossover junction endodeoxyribonuclease [Gemmatirosa sp.]|nr:RusA family crossover junction endodeoxyribonuclease [Gemmatirosa sp.]